ncbi:MAG: RDD family protein, partial [Verrucomicrobiia bacterium]
MTETGYAGFGRRIAACVIDSLFLLIAGWIINLTVGPFRTEEQAQMTGLTLGILLNWFYFAGMESSRMQA